MSRYGPMTDEQIDQLINDAYQRGWKTGRLDAADEMAREIRGDLEERTDAKTRKII